MSEPAEQLARELLREAGFLPERWRLWLLEGLREELANVDQEQLEIDRLGARMLSATEALDRVADHLKLEDKREQLRLTIEQFDEAPESVRGDWRARQVAKVLRGSWALAKGIAFDDQQLPVAAELHRKQRQGVSRKRRESTPALSAVAAWLDTNPKKREAKAYDAWVKSRSKALAEGQKPMPLAGTLWYRWRVPFAEIVKAVKAGRIPGEDPNQEAKSDAASEQSKGTKSKPARPLNLDPSFRSQLLRERREAAGLLIKGLGAATGLDPSQLGKIERGEVRNSSFDTWAKLAHELGFSLDELAAGPADLDQPIP
jgi:hypothetical protein